MPPTPSPRSLADLEALEAARGPNPALPAESTWDLLRQSADKGPDADALVFLPTPDPDGPPVVLSHRQLFERVTRCANALSALGVERQTVVSILLPSLPETHEALWGAEAVGIANPINFLLRREEIVGLLETAGTRVLIALGPHPDLDIWQKALYAAQELPDLETLLRVDVGDPAGKAPDDTADATAMANRASTEEAPLRETRIVDFRSACDGAPGGVRLSSPPPVADDIAAYFHTGGTTGSPKLARHSHGNQVFAAWGTALLQGLCPTDRVLNALPLFHVAGSLAAGLAPLGAGAALLIPTAAGARHPGVVQNFWRLMERHRVTVITGVPTSIAAVGQVPVGTADLSAARLAITGASPLPPEVGRRFESVSGIPLHEMYGMTETAGLVALEPWNGERAHGCVGLRAPHTEVQIRHHQAGQPSAEVCSPGQGGAVVVRGPNVFQGYLDSTHDEGLFLDDGFLVTGDLGRLDDQGRLWLTGRAKDVIIRSGHNIDPAIVEQAAESHSWVHLAAAVGMPDPYAGEVPILYVTLLPAGDREADADTQSGERASDGDARLRAAEEILAHVHENIAEPPARPRRVIILPELPMTAVGKPFRPQLRCDATRQAAEEALRELAAEVPLRAQALLESGGLVVEVVGDSTCLDPETFRQRVAGCLDCFSFSHRTRIGPADS